jgi:hypothetical protein
MELYEICHILYKKIKNILTFCETFFPKQKAHLNELSELAAFVIKIVERLAFSYAVRMNKQVL